MTTPPGRKTLLPEAVLEDFGPRSACARQTVGALYRAAEGVEGDMPGLSRGARQPVRGPNPWKELAESLELPEAASDPRRLLLAVQTYYALFCKLLGCRAFPTPERPDAGMRDELAWYRTCWNDELAHAIDGLVTAVADYGVLPAENASEPPADVLKPLYHRLLPRRVRHRLGEYYTPDWLAELVLDRAAYRGEPGVRLLDPACGSGTFLVLAIRRLRRRCREAGLDRAATLAAILENVAGIDLSPLAIAAARTNFLLSIADLLEEGSPPPEIPVYRADSIVAAPDDPLPSGLFDVIVGNPPWVGWEHLAPEYRCRTHPLWQRYGLFPHGGMDALLGKGKKDLSMLMSYAVTDRWLKPGGRLALVLTQSVLKTAGSGQGFRRFDCGDGERVRVESVDDFSGLQVFEGASTRASVLVWTKGPATTYPVPYTVWEPNGRGGTLPAGASLERVRAATRRLARLAEPVRGDDPTSPWLTASPSALEALRSVLGESPYRAYAGVYSGGANGVYWLEILERRKGGIARVRNITAGTRRPVPEVTADIEADLLYPLLRGNDVRRWQATPSAWFLLVQDPAARRGINETELRRQYPLAFAYLERFRDVLRERRDRGTRQIIAHGGPFYSVFGVGPYTLAPHKAVWHRMIAPLGVAALACREGRPVLPQETHVFVPADSDHEAAYLAGMMNSSPFNCAALAYSQAGGKSFGSPHILQNLRLPRYDLRDAEHRTVAALAGELQERRENGQPPDAALEEELDAAAARAWRLTQAQAHTLRQELAAYRASGEASEKERTQRT